MRIAILHTSSIPSVEASATQFLLSEEASKRACTRSRWYWPEAHTPTAFARVLESTNDVENVLKLARDVAASVVSAPEAVLYVESAELVYTAASFCEQMADASADDFPVSLFVAWVGRENPDGTFDLRSEGLRAFDLPEVETEKSARDGEVTLEILCDAALFVLFAETQPADGDVVELTQGSFRFRTMPSLGGSGASAYRIRIK